MPTNLAANIKLFYSLVLFYHKRSMHWEPKKKLYDSVNRQYNSHKNEEYSPSAEWNVWINLGQGIQQLQYLLTNSQSD